MHAIAIDMPDLQLVVAHAVDWLRIGAVEELQAHGRDAEAHQLLVLLEVRLADVVRLAAPRDIEKGVRLAQNMQIGPCIPVGTQLLKG